MLYFRSDLLIHALHRAICESPVLTGLRQNLSPFEDFNRATRFYQIMSLFSGLRNNKLLNQRLEAPLSPPTQLYVFRGN